MIKYIIKGTLCLLLAGCTSVDFCDDAQHPHSANVYVDYSWENVSVPTDSMVLIAYRPINDWKCVYMCSPLTAEGRYIFNKPEWLPASSEEFVVRTGELIFATFNYSKDAFKYNYVENCKAASFTSMSVEQKTCTLNELPEYLTKGWKEYNKYAPYIVGDGNLVYRKVGLVGVPEDSYSLEMAPVSLMKNVTVSVDIVNSGVEIEKVVGELSGVCYGFNLVKGTCNTKKTAKMLFEMKKEESDATVYSANLQAMNLVANKSRNSYKGDGILQLAIHTLLPDGGKKVYMARVNLMNTLFNVSEQLSGIGGDCAIKPSMALTVYEDRITAQQDASMYVDNWSIVK